MPDPITKPNPNPAEPPVNPAGNDGVDPASKPARPEGFGESLASYWNDDKGADFTKLTEDMAALTAFKAERDSLAAQVPANLDEYEVALPENFALPDGIKLPDGMKLEVAADDPLAPHARAIAKELGLTKDQFRKLVGLQAMGRVMEHNKLSELAAAEKAKLGSKGADRINAVTTWAKAAIGEKHAGALMPMMFTAGQIEAFEALMKVAKGGGLQINNGGRETSQPKEISADEYAKLTPVERINRNRQLAAG